jgi:Na+/proline symporter
VLYTAFGGLLADAVTDLVQSVLIAIGLIALLVAVVVQLGGPGAFMEAVTASPRWLPPGGGQPLLPALEAWTIPVLGSLIASESISRVIATRSPTVARRASYAAGTIYLLIGTIPVVLAVAAASLVPALADPEQFLPELARAVLPTFGYVLLAGAVISAILSTVDSTLLVASGLLSHNLLVPLLGITEQPRRVKLARAGVVAFGVLAYVLARHAEGVYALVEQASAFGGGGVLVTVSFGLFTRHGGPRAAFATLAVGVLSYVGLTFTGFPYPFVTSIGLSLGTYLTVALWE